MIRVGTAAVLYLIVGAAGAVAADRARDITFDTVKFDIKIGDPFDRSLLTSEIKELDGKVVRVRGYMYPSFQQSGIKQFILVRDNMECCFGPKAALYDCMIVDMVDGTTTDFSVIPITVEGVFALREIKGPDGKHLAIYHLDATSVK